MNNLYLLTTNDWCGKDVIVVASSSSDALSIAKYLFSDDDKEKLKVFSIDMTRSRPLIQLGGDEETPSGYIERVGALNTYSVCMNLKLR